MKSAKHLAEVKTALAEKYDNLARLAGSTPKRNTFQTQANKHRRQAAALLRQHAQSQRPAGR